MSNQGASSKHVRVIFLALPNTSNFYRFFPSRENHVDQRSKGYCANKQWDSQ